jgi:hypothetical protein
MAVNSRQGKSLSTCVIILFISTYEYDTLQNECVFKIQNLIYELNSSAWSDLDKYNCKVSKAIVIVIINKN